MFGIQGTGFPGQGQGFSVQRSQQGGFRPSFQRQGPVVYWRPLKGERHALPPTHVPRPGEERETLCGLNVTTTDPSDVDWLDPTCGHCMARATALRDARN